MSNLPKGAKSSGLFNIMADAVSNSKAATTSYILNKDIKIGGSYDEWGNKTIPLQNSNTEYKKKEELGKEIQKSGLDVDIAYKTVIDNHDTIYHIAYITGCNME